mmetsp:Transcript_21866/g.32727  ORF Transcript_21866/g.32727 Transcript_21866/m.32727 type:complete len:135 (-) Transcript_21866:1427-1831(-)
MYNAQDYCSIQKKLLDKATINQVFIFAFSRSLTSFNPLSLVTFPWNLPNLPPPLPLKMVATSLPIPSTKFLGPVSKNEPSSTDKEVSGLPTKRRTGASSSVQLSVTVEESKVMKPMSIPYPKSITAKLPFPFNS